MIQSNDGTPLSALTVFCNKHLRGTISTVHLLPFYPYSSDDGFSVIDYREVDPEVGTWKDVQRLGSDFKLMFDLVLNHCSAQSAWFKNFQTGIAPDRHYFIEADPTEALSSVVRPRTSPLLTPTNTRQGKTHIWTTFSADQVDLNWQNPDLFFEFLDILLLYLSYGAKIIRMDAIAFLWKKIGTTCLHLPETHEIIKLFRDIVDMLAPDVVLLTETNVPHEENVSYFGNADEAHMVYNFSLPPLVLHALLNSNGEYLTNWAGALEDPPEGCTYFNFTASHDGVGVRPLQGLLPDEELQTLASQIRDRGGHISSKSDSDGKESPYEMNITYYSALADADNQQLGITRFLCSQAIALAFRGVPGIYFHSLTATTNNDQGVRDTGRARTINRYRWNEVELNAQLADTKSHHSIVFDEYLKMLRRRRNYPAFHPDSPMTVYRIAKELFVLSRTSTDGEETVYCLFNLSDKQQSISNARAKKLLNKSTVYHEILSARTVTIEKNPLALKPYQAMWLVPRG